MVVVIFLGCTFGKTGTGTDVTCGSGVGSGSGSGSGSTLTDMREADRCIKSSSLIGMDSLYREFISCSSETDDTETLEFSVMSAYLSSNSPNIAKILSSSFLSSADKPVYFILIVYQSHSLPFFNSFIIFTRSLHIACSNLVALLCALSKSLIIVSMMVWLFLDYLRMICYLGCDEARRV